MSIVFDSGTLISFSQSCLIEILERLQKNLGQEFLVSNTVYREIVVNPMKIRRFELNAVRLHKAIESKWLTLIDATPMEIARMNELSTLANQSYLIDHHCLNIVQGGESEALAICNERRIDVLAMDERTTRMLIENPGQLQNLLRERNQKPVEMMEQNARQFGEPFKDLTIVRSVELLALAYSRGLFEPTLAQRPAALEAGLFALKFAGCAVSENEITEYLENPDRNRK